MVVHSLRRTACHIMNATRDPSVVFALQCMGSRLLCCIVLDLVIYNSPINIRCNVRNVTSIYISVVLTLYDTDQPYILNERANPHVFPA